MPESDGQATQDAEGVSSESVSAESMSAEPETVVKTAPDLTPAELDESISLALTALHEIAEYNFVGNFHEALDEGDGVYSLRFISNSPGFRDWWWTVTMTRVEDADTPTVLECGLLPGEDALLAPEWVPWAKRLARFRATHDSHGNPLPETDEQEESKSETAPRTRTRKRTRTRLRRRGESVKAAAAESEARDDAVAEESVQLAVADENGSEVAASEDNDSLPVAADIRDFAEEMDEVLDGVDFEDDSDGDDSEEDDSED